jgi:NSS family neurotransmitter:Na+ symporter
MTASNSHSHAQWSSRLGFVLAATGSAVGLGNIWKFPYMIGQSGGAAFVLIYLLCIALIGLPILVAEWMIGRRGQKNPINTMSELARRNKRSQGWMVVGITGVLGAFLILSFYSVIGGWAFAYVGDAIGGGFRGLDAEGAGALFTGMLGNPGVLLLWHTAFMAATIWVVAMGVTGGLERAAKLLMPGLGVLLMILVIYGMTSGGFGAALAYLFNPDWSLLTGEVVLAALGHAFFTLSLGMGIMMAYGSYLDRKVDLLRTARTVVIMDTVIAIAAGLAIFPIVFQQSRSRGRSRPDLRHPPSGLRRYHRGHASRPDVLPAAELRRADLGDLTARTDRRAGRGAHTVQSYGRDPGCRSGDMGAGHRRTAVVQRVERGAGIRPHGVRPARSAHQ